jgi:hypothetical protein
MYVNQCRDLALGGREAASSEVRSGRLRLDPAHLLLSIRSWSNSHLCSGSDETYQSRPS